MRIGIATPSGHVRTGFSCDPILDRAAAQVGHKRVEPVPPVALEAVRLVERLGGPEAALLVVLEVALPVEPEPDVPEVRA